MSEFLFEQLSLSPEMMRAIEQVHYTTATEIQAKTIPLLLEGKDVIGRSNTGTGKTAAFGIPAIETTDPSVKKPQVLILSPTRELAMQICEEMRKFAQYKQGIKIAVVYGGAPIERQFRDLKGANIIIGTPGRVMDHMRRHTLKLQDIKTVILDEADEMLNMGFVDDIKLILSEVPQERQTVLFSATMPPAIMNLTAEFQNDPETVVVNKGQRTLDAIEQVYYQVPMGRKMDVLNILLQMYEPKRSIVFCNTKKMVDELVVYLNEHGFKAIGLHGDMKQTVRTQVMENYKSGRIHILVATDVAARGIDVENVEAVFNYDIPQDNEYYIHRIGRTGRAGKTGMAFTLITNRKQIYWMRDIARFTKSEVQERPIPSFDDLVEKREEKLRAKLQKALEEDHQQRWGELIDSFAAEGYDYRKTACALMELVAGKDKRTLPVVKAVVGREKGIPQTAGHGNRVKLTVDIGRNERIAPNFIVGAIVEGTGLPASAIGKIDIYNEHTIIDMSGDDAQVVLDSMTHSRIKNKRVHFALDGKKDGRSERFAKASYERGGRGKRFGRDDKRSKGHSHGKKHNSGWK